jgi:hypothetical protein
VLGPAIGSSEWLLLIPTTAVAVAAITLCVQPWREPAGVHADLGAADVRVRC